MAAHRWLPDSPRGPLVELRFGLLWAVLMTAANRRRGKDGRDLREQPDSSRRHSVCMHDRQDSCYFTSPVFLRVSAAGNKHVGLGCRCASGFQTCLRQVRLGNLDPISFPAVARSQACGSSTAARQSKNSLRRFFPDYCPVPEAPNVRTGISRVLMLRQVPGGPAAPQAPPPQAPRFSQPLSEKDAWRRRGLAR
jgi:hypothetical protein